VTFETFANVSELEQLDLSYNNLKTLDINILKALPKLSVLYLGHNQISEIIPGTLEKNSFLEFLDLGYNNIEHLRSDAFNGLVNLHYIKLEFNKLQYFHPETFVELPYFERLNLSHNYGLQIRTHGHFISSHSMKYLGISGCNISSVSVEAFVKVSALQLIDLGNNNLRILDISILKALPQLSTLYLQGNPLQCDCQLQEVWRWCQDHNIETEYWEMVPKCDTPSEVEGIWWGVLEKGQCLQGNIQYYGDYKNTSYSDKQIEDTDIDKYTETELDTETVMWKKSS
jgi:Leucine-rich repeat (LRR) protein